MAAVEFALVAPAVLIILLGVADLAVLIRAAWHLERSAGELANVIAQLDSLREADFPALFDVANRIADPYDLTGQGGAVIITGLSGTASGPVVSWRRRTGAADLLTRFGTSGAPALPVGFTLPSGQTAIAVETYARVTPWVLAINLLGERAQVLAGFGMFRPRLSSLASILP
jgi:Flp pilus assembly protein TadG